MLPFWRGYKKISNGESLSSQLLTSATVETKEQITLKKDIQTAITALLADCSTLATLCGTNALSIDFVFTSKNKRIEETLSNLQKKTPDFYKLLCQLHVRARASVYDTGSFEAILKEHRINELHESLQAMLSSSSLPGYYSDFNAVLGPIIEYMKIITDRSASLSALQEHKLTKDFSSNIKNINETIAKWNYDTSLSGSNTQKNFYDTLFPGLIEKVLPDIKKLFAEFDELLQEFQAFREDKKNPASPSFVKTTIDLLQAFKTKVTETYAIITTSLRKHSEYGSLHTVEKAFKPLFASLQSGALRPPSQSPPTVRPLSLR